ncbi:hypothetical protein ABRG53_4245 [Pseudanabaena sp. ABRG5-3]|nr:hypothetical protein ABRG53_4245 [Pseudanabaena sp. ABRG5-3]
MGAAVAALLKLGMLTSNADTRLKAIAVDFIVFSVVCIIPVIANLTGVAIAQFREVSTLFVVDLAVLLLTGCTNLEIYSALRSNPNQEIF